MNGHHEIPELFGSLVFNDDIMQRRLPKDIYKSLRKTIDSGKSLDITVANAVANAMKDWAIEKGATHYTHWFQPMTGITAEKHDSFISPTADGRIIMEFSGKELIKGEPDASSFPSGGLRATFEARGYTTWDPTSYTFIKDGSLCIPTAFCSYGGEVLDKKTPLLKSMEALNVQALRILRLFGDIYTKKVTTTVGAEQEYFLVDKKLFDKRDDLLFCGRTLYGAKAPKGQEMDDHYFGAIKPRVMAYMKELDEELWKLGILAKTKHNEAAPAQHELAPIFTTTNIATDHHQLTMEIMKNVAKKHDLVCLLHEKPFGKVTGSGKHNNWSMSTDSGKNLLNPGKHPQENAQFLLFLCAIIKGVDEYQELLRVSAASAGNDLRLGANEAPPAIISIFLGDELTNILEAIENNDSYEGPGSTHMEIGVHALPNLPKDTTDRNRTSPFAFTGNKFEFRMLGSSMSIACSNVIMNTIVTEELKQFADILENTNDFSRELNELIKRVYRDHKRIIFNGDGYSEAWVKEAEKRGLYNLKTTVDALPHYISEKSIDLFTSHKIYTPVELKSRHDVILENYSKTINIEALTMLQMFRRDIYPAVSKYIKELCEEISVKKSVLPDLIAVSETEIVKKLSTNLDKAYSLSGLLETNLEKGKVFEGKILDLAKHYKDSIIPVMELLREAVDSMETLVSRKLWPYPTYGDLMFKV
ncbi:MAG: glutamine synthetase III [Clostridia bacterium]|nr:glutamine synthetase III [Clostridia bacterium]